MDEYCCEIKEFCDNDPNTCPIAKQNKAVVDFEVAKQKLIDVINEGINEFFKKWLYGKEDDNA